MARRTKIKPEHKSKERMSSAVITRVTPKKKISKQVASRYPAPQKATKVSLRRSARVVNRDRGVTFEESDKPSLFFCLPLEVRTIIYKMVFHTNNKSRNAPAEDNTTIEVADPRVSRERYDSGAWADYLHLLHRYRSKPPRGPRLMNYSYAQLDFLRCCRQIMLEARPIFWNTMTFRFAGFSALRLFMNQGLQTYPNFDFDFPHPESILVRVRNVELMPTMLHHSRFVHTAATFILELLAKAPNLAEFAVVHDVDSAVAHGVITAAEQPFVPCHKQCVCYNCRYIADYWKKLKEINDDIRKEQRKKDEALEEERKEEESKEKESKEKEAKEAEKVDDELE